MLADQLAEVVALAALGWAVLESAVQGSAVQGSAAQWFWWDAA